MINQRDIQSLKDFANNYEAITANIQTYRKHIEEVRPCTQNIKVMLPSGLTNGKVILTLSHEKCIDLLSEEISELEEKQRSMTLEGLFREVSNSVRISK